MAYECSADVLKQDTGSEAPTVPSGGKSVETWFACLERFVLFFCVYLVVHAGLLPLVYKTMFLLFAPWESPLPALVIVLFPINCLLCVVLIVSSISVCVFRRLATAREVLAVLVMLMYLLFALNVVSSL